MGTRIRLTEDDKMFLIDLTGNRVEFEEEEHKAVAIEMWYDRHYRHWVLYPVDEEGNQLHEARYGFGKKEALKFKRDLEEEYEIR